MTASEVGLEFHGQPAAMTSAGRHAPLLAALPRGVPGLARAAQGLLLHEHWASRCGVALSDERRSESHLRPVARMLDRLLARDGRPLSAARSPGERLVGVCRHFSIFVVAALRARGLAARARCGFGSYFEPGRFVDHWVAEYWSGSEGRWVRIDAQIDDVQRAALPIDFDVLDVPPDRFVVAGAAWEQCREGAVDPERFGIFDLQGLWFVAGNLVRDFAALNRVEMLPWDVWGAMPGPGEPLGRERIALFDRVAELTRAPDARFEELRELYEKDDRLRVPAIVRNALLGREEAIRPGGGAPCSTCS
jgi:hypothetical protein